MTAIRASRLSFAYEGRSSLLGDVSFSLSPGFTGLVGENGAGKTTLLRLLSGELRPDSGELSSVPEGARVVVCEQTVTALTDDLASFAEDATGEAYRLRGLLDLEPESLARWSTLSPGERKRWQVGAALFSAPDVLLLDEPTNHLDAAARALLVKALGRFRGIGVIVAHDRELLSALTRSTLRVHRGTARLYAGSYDDARAAWEAEEAAVVEERAARVSAARSMQRRLDDKRREQASAQAGLSSGARMKDRYDHDARGGLAKGLAQAAEKKIGRDVGVVREKLARAERAVSELQVEKSLGRSVFVGYERSPHPRVATLAADELRAGDRTLLTDVHLVVSRADRVWIRGDNGAGKSTLLRALVASSRHLFYVPQEIDRVPDVRALEPAARGRVLSMVAALGVDPEKLLDSGRPSPGEARKLFLAFGLGTHVAGLALDEPTNHLDLPSVERLQAALDAFPGALLLVTHDARLAAAVTDETWTVSGGRVNNLATDRRGAASIR